MVQIPMTTDDKIDPPVTSSVQLQPDDCGMPGMSRRRRVLLEVGRPDQFVKFRIEFLKLDRLNVFLAGLLKHVLVIRDALQRPNAI